MAVQDFRDLIVWQKAMDLVELVYRLRVSFRREEMYGLTNQVRRAAVSVPSNIAEGHARDTTLDLMHFLSISRGSLKELETQILIAGRLGYIGEQAESRAVMLIAEISRLMSGLTNSLRRRVAATARKSRTVKRSNST
jgi:four helix bundle protein